MYRLTLCVFVRSMLPPTSRQKLADLGNIVRHALDLNPDIVSGPSKYHVSQLGTCYLYTPEDSTEMGDRGLSFEYCIHQPKDADETVPRQVPDVHSVTVYTNGHLKIQFDLHLLDANADKDDACVVDTMGDVGLTAAKSSELRALVAEWLSSSHTPCVRNLNRAVASRMSSVC